MTKKRQLKKDKKKKGQDKSKEKIQIVESGLPVLRIFLNADAETKETMTNMIEKSGMDGNVLKGLSVLCAYVKISSILQDGVVKMLEIIDNPTSDEDEKNSALSTIADALGML